MESVRPVSPRQTTGIHRAIISESREASREVESISTQHQTMTLKLTPLVFVKNGAYTMEDVESARFTGSGMEEDGIMAEYSSVILWEESLILGPGDRFPQREAFSKGQEGMQTRGLLSGMQRNPEESDEQAAK